MNAVVLLILQLCTPLHFWI